MASINNPMTYKSKFKKLRGFVVDEVTGRPLPNVVVNVTIEPDEGVLISLGPLASDNAGYVAFDLLLYLGKFTPNPRQVWVEALGTKINRKVEVPKLGQETFGYDFLLRIDEKTVPHHKSVQIELPSIQSPDLTDWEISPHSFVAKSHAPDALFPLIFGWAWSCVMFRCRLCFTPVYLSLY